MDRRTFLTAAAATAFARPALGRSGWPGGYVSLTYDGGLDSQLDIAVPQLNGARLHGTFYVTWENIEDRAAEWAALPTRGHELANHSMSHPCDLQREDVATFAQREIDPLQDWLERVEGPSQARDFAYPCDVTNLGPGSPNEQARRYARLLRRAGILRARTSEGPPNSARWASRAPYRLQALALAYDTAGLAEVQDYLLRAIRRRAWAILVIHEIGDGRREDGFIPASEHLGLIQMIQGLRIPCGTVTAAAGIIGGGT